jgi:hypothetical protein
MTVLGRFGTTYKHVNLTGDQQSDNAMYRYFHDQLSDDTIATVLQAIKFRSHYIYCEEQPIFKNGGIDYNIVQSDYYDRCMDFVVEVMPALVDDEWDYDTVLEEWVKSFLSLEVPDCDEFLATDKNRVQIFQMLFGLCLDTLETGGEDYESLIEEAVESFCDHFEAC